jgi:hypothetical protein
MLRAALAAWLETPLNERKAQMTRRMLLIARIGALVLAIAIVPTALAAKGGKPAPTPATVTATFSTDVLAGGQIDLAGCGYLVEPVQIRVIDSTGSTLTYGAGVYSTGCFSGYVPAGAPGAYTVEVWQHASPQLHLMASATLTV